LKLLACEIYRFNNPIKINTSLLYGVPEGIGE